MSDPSKIVVNSPNETKPSNVNSPIKPLGLNVMTHSLEKVSIEISKNQNDETKKP